MREWVGKIQLIWSRWMNPTNYQKTNKGTMSILRMNHTHARWIRDEAVKYQINLDRWDERFYQNERRKLIEKLRALRGAWEPERPDKDRWPDWEETKQRKIGADRYGILVNCVVDWSTDTVDNPLFLIDIHLHPDATVPFASLLSS